MIGRLKDLKVELKKFMKDWLADEDMDGGHQISKASSPSNPPSTQKCSLVPLSLLDAQLFVNSRLPLPTQLPV